LDASIRPADISTAPVRPECSAEIKIDPKDDSFAVIAKFSQEARAWPFFAADAELSSMKATKIMVQADEFDSLRDEGLLFYQRLKKLGLDATLSYLHNATHVETFGSVIFGIPETAASRKGLADIVMFLRKSFQV